MVANVRTIVHTGTIATANINIKEPIFRSPHDKQKRTNDEQQRQHEKEAPTKLFGQANDER